VGTPTDNPLRRIARVEQEPAGLIPNPLEPPRVEEPPAEDFLEPVKASTRMLRVYLNRALYFRSKRPIVRVVVADPLVADAALIDDEREVVRLANEAAGVPQPPQPGLEPKAPGGRLLAVVGNRFGQTQVTVWDDKDEAQTFNISVTIDELDLQNRLRQALPGCQVIVRQLAQQIILEGQVRDSQTMNQVIQLVQSELRISGQANTGSLSQAVGVGTPAAVGAGGGGGGTSQSVGVNAGPGQSPLSVASTGNAQPGLIIVNRMRVPGPRQVQLKVKIAELDRSAIREIGVNFSYLGSTDSVITAIGGIAPAAGGLLGQTQQVVGVFDSGKFNVFLNALRQNDLAKILAEPTLVTMDGQPAQFQAGGNFPYPVPQAGNVGTAITINFAPFGAILQFLPTILPGDVIQLDVEPVFSELNPATGVSILGTSVPGINVRSARTVVALREGQTLAIAGLLQTRTNGTTARIPLVGDIPVIGQAFSRDSITVRETELIVLVTPELVEAVDPREVPPAPGDKVLEPNDMEFYLLGRLEGKTGHPFRSTVHYLDPWNIMRHKRSQERWVVGPHGYSE
jgi:pilus assembly protein CpaC